MTGRLAHQLGDEFVTVVMRPASGMPMTLQISYSEAKRFAWSLLADVDPDADDESGGETVEPQQFGRLVVDHDAGAIRVGEINIPVSVTQFRIIAALAKHAPRPLARTDVMIAVYGRGKAPDEKIVDVFLCRLRNKLKPYGADAQIETVYGRGWRLTEAPTADAYQAHSQSHPSKMQAALLGRLKDGDATFPELWCVLPESAENSVRNALTTLLERGEIVRSGLHGRSRYGLPVRSALPA